MYIDPLCLNHVEKQQQILNICCYPTHLYTHQTGGLINPVRHGLLSNLSGKMAFHVLFLKCHFHDDMAWYRIMTEMYWIDVI